MVAGDGEAEASQALSGLLNVGHDKLLVDLAGVTAMDSSGVGVLMRLRNDADQSGARIRLLHLTRRVHRVLELASLTQLFDIFDNEDEALAGF